MSWITKRDKILSVADRWREQYPKEKEDVYKKLKSLNLETASEKEVSDIIGNDSWTNIMCDECEKDVGAVYHLECYEQNIRICLWCLKRAVADYKE
jgi:hypothetical protein